MDWMEWTFSDLKIFKRRQNYDRKEFARVLPYNVFRRLHADRDFIRDAEEDAPGSPRAEGIEPRVVWHQLHRKRGGEEMRIDSTGRETQKKKSKAKSKSQLETMMFQMI